MRKTVFFLLLLPLLAMAKGPAIKFLEKSHEFGNIPEKGDAAQTEFRFINTGDSPLVILSAKASCGCTKPSFPDAPIAPGDTASVTVRYEPDGHPGEFNKTITVRSNASNGSTTRLKIKGCVIPPHP